MPCPPCRRPPTVSTSSHHVVLVVVSLLCLRAVLHLNSGVVSVLPRLQSTALFVACTAVLQRLLLTPYHVLRRVTIGTSAAGGLYRPHHACPLCPLRLHNGIREDAYCKYSATFAFVFLRLGRSGNSVCPPPCLLVALVLCLRLLRKLSPCTPPTKAFASPQTTPRL